MPKSIITIVLKSQDLSAQLMSALAEDIAAFTVDDTVEAALERSGFDMEDTVWPNVEKAFFTITTEA